MIKKADIQRFYAKDADLINQFHVLAPTTLESAVEHTFKSIKKLQAHGAKTFVSEQWYATIITEKGYTLLVAFFIDCDLRKDEVIKARFMKFLAFHGVTHSCVWDRNIRAKRFFEKNSFKFVTKIFDDEENQEYCVYEKV